MYYLGINELNEFVKIEAIYSDIKNKLMKYIRWLVALENKSSYICN